MLRRTLPARPRSVCRLWDNCIHTFRRYFCNFQEQNHLHQHPQHQLSPLTPSDIFNSLSEHVVGQEQVKMALSVGVYKHLVAMKHNKHREHSPVAASVNDTLFDRKTLDGFGLHDSQKKEYMDKSVNVAKVQVGVDLGAMEREKQWQQQNKSPYTMPSHMQTSEQLRMKAEADAEAGSGSSNTRPVSIRLGSGKIVQHQGIGKTNILLMGSTGTGKTLLAQTLADLIGVPMVCTDATALTQAGYVGEDVESLLAQLYARSGYDMSMAERGIVYIDEIDKIARKSTGPSMTRDVSGEGVQQSLLKLLEGSEVSIPKVGLKQKPGGDTVMINTRHILFICAGSFAGIEHIVSDRLKREEVEGSADWGHVQTDDLMKFGLIPEFIGRFPIVTTTNPLTLEELTDIIHQPKNALMKQYEYFFALHHMELVVTPDACRAIAEKAMQRGTGARGLRSIVEKLLTPVMFYLPDNVTALSEGAGITVKKESEDIPTSFFSSTSSTFSHTALVDVDVVRGVSGVLLLRGDLTVEEYIAAKQKHGEGERFANIDNRVVEVTSPVTRAPIHIKNNSSDN